MRGTTLELDRNGVRLTCSRYRSPIQQRPNPDDCTDNTETHDDDGNYDGC